MVLRSPDQILKQVQDDVHKRGVTHKRGVRSCFMRSALLNHCKVCCGRSNLADCWLMARPLRIEFEGALYHVMARGNARAAIFLDDEDRQAFIDNLGRVCGRFDWRVWAWCEMYRDQGHEIRVRSCDLRSAAHARCG